MMIWIISSLLFLIGAACLMLRRQLLAMVLGLELLINAANVNLVYSACRRGDAAGLAIALLVIAVAAAEVVVGFALLISLSRDYSAAETQEIRDLAG